MLKGTLPRSPGTMAKTKPGTDESFRKGNYHLCTHSSLSTEQFISHASPSFSGFSQEYKPKPQHRLHAKD